MPETEPTPWELMRMLKSMDMKLDKVVTREAFEAESKRIDGRLGDLGTDIVNEQLAREKAVTAERVAREKAQAEAAQKADKQANNLRWLAAAIILPVALFIANLLTAGGS